MMKRKRKECRKGRREGAREIMKRKGKECRKRREWQS